MPLTNPAIRALAIQDIFDATGTVSTFSMTSGFYIGGKGDVTFRMGNDPSDASKDVTFYGIQGFVEIRACRADVDVTGATGIVALWSD